MTWVQNRVCKKQIEKKLEGRQFYLKKRVMAFLERPTMKFETFTEQWFKEYAEPNLRIRTVDRYKTFIRTYFRRNRFPSYGQDNSQTHSGFRK